MLLRSGGRPSGQQRGPCRLIELIKFRSARASMNRCSPSSKRAGTPSEERVKDVTKPAHEAVSFQERTQRH